MGATETIGRLPILLRRGGAPVRGSGCCRLPALAGRSLPQDFADTAIVAIFTGASPLFLACITIPSPESHVFARCAGVLKLERQIGTSDPNLNK